MSVLVVGEHDNAELNLATLSAVTAAVAIDSDVHLLIAGSGCGSVAEAAVKVQGVTKVLVADNALYEHDLGERLAAIVTKLADGYSHILTAATSSGKNFMPRVAALLDVQQISEIV